ncbi:Stk1 family PASTA domain-containing Ser/Thr kinase [Bacillus sp. FJAT-42376]|uniref:Stk1 family PASTA domain-containing Ser/Thr kinase n=1 Tax=Bacillus sp. FJAT-42376 TaxID=2014076 RepID=UPI000F4E0C2B|nr:Stk1 family PASTA domain-containing Ser/Thr kinase [Bacillus sp. FJAT-42376]AZB42892.1 Stk1 family PASTA domain-containing Ser/Thr kinase [Bacillus sp. FJAT-42376]
MLIGKRISGRYRILEVIGGGGMANVYLAQDVILERKVAVKVLRFDFANDEDFIRRFRREAQSTTSLDHPNIVSIFDVGEENGIYYIVMEYVAGTTLKQYIQNHAPLHPAEALDIMVQIVSAIAHAHENLIVHRDIKPHNILLDHDGRVKVTDFGIAMALSSATITHTNSVLGSVHYLSPEQARGGLATKKSDLYSLGIVLYEMLTGRVPYDGESAVSIALKHLQSETPQPERWNPSIPQSMSNIIIKAMAKDPFHRYNSAEEMEEDLKTALNADRLYEKKYEIPADDEATKAIPVITDGYLKGDKDATHPYSAPAQAANELPKADDPKKKKKKKSKFAVFIITLFIILLAAGVSAVTILPSLFLPDDVSVPDVSGEEYGDAVNKLSDAGFKVTERSMTSDEVPENYVVKTDPEKGNMAKKGSLVTIYQSTGKKTAELEEVLGRDIQTAKELLERKGYKNVTIEEINDEEEAGLVIDQEPSAGTEVIPSEDEVTLTVSKGPEELTMEDLNGFTRDYVKLYAKQNGIILSEKEEYSDTVPEGKIISQNPGAGEKLKPGDTLEAVFSLGKEQQEIATVSKEIDIPYEPSVPDEEQEVQILINDAERSFSAPFETFKMKGPEKRTIEFKIAPGQNAYYQVTVNSRIVKSETVPYPE